MRTLKKTLALVLVLAMMFSLCAFSASADFTDAEEITNAKAVATLVGLGVIEGMPDGTFDPAGTLTRAQAAKIIAYLHGVGEIAADPAETEFSDVAASHWASGYIAYCTEEGIIEGYGNGKFGPSDTLTGYQWTKMLLCALGYDSSIEGYTGSAWQINVAKDAVTVGVWTGADADNKAAISRDNACLYAFNILNDTAKQTVKVLDSVVYGTDLGNFVEYYLNTVVDTDVETEDALGRPVSAVTGTAKVAGAKAVTYYAETATPVLTYTAGVKADTIKKDLGLATKDFAKADLGTFAEAGKGVLVEVYEADKDATDETTNYTVLVIETKVQTLAKADITAAKDATDTAEAVKASIKLGDIVYETADYAEGDVVLYNVGENGEDEDIAVNVAKAEVVTGKITAKGTGYVKIGADKYEFAASCTDTLSVGKEYNLYLDQYGYIKATADVKEAATDTTETLVYVVDTYSIDVDAVEPEYDSYGDAIKDTGSAAYTATYAQCVDMEGKEVSYLIKVVTGKGDAATTVGSDVTAKQILAVEYDKDAKVYKMSEAKGAAQITINKDAISYNGYYYNTAEYVSVIGSKAKLSVSEGAIADVDGETVWAAFETVKGTSNKTVTKIFYWAEAEAEADTTYTAAVLATGAKATEQSTITYTGKDGKDVTVAVYTHEVYINGEKMSVLSYEETLAADFYGYYVDEHDVYVVAELDGVEAAIDNIYGNYVTIDGVCADYDVTGIKVVDLTADGNGKLDTGDVVAFYAYKAQATDKTYTIPCIYITYSAKADGIVALDPTNAADMIYYTEVLGMDPNVITGYLENEGYVDHIVIQYNRPAGWETLDITIKHESGRSYTMDKAWKPAVYGTVGYCNWFDNTDLGDWTYTITVDGKLVQEGSFVIK